AVRRPAPPAWPGSFPSVSLPEILLASISQARRSGQLDLEVRALVVMQDPGRARPAGEAPGAGIRHDVAEPDIGIGLEPAVLHGHRTLLPAVGTPGNPFGGHVRAGSFLAARGHEQRGGVPD